MIVCRDNTKPTEKNAEQRTHDLSCRFTSDCTCCKFHCKFHYLQKTGCGKSLYQFLLLLVVPCGLCYSAYGYLLRVFFIHVRRTKEYRYYGGHTRIVEKNIGWKIRMIEMRLKRDSKNNENLIRR